MGDAICRRVGAGRTILLADVDVELLNRVSRSLTDDGFAVTAERVDVSSRDSVASLARRASTLGEVRAVVHTAGVSPVQASVKTILGVDLAGVAYSLDEFGAVIARGGAGVFIASMAGSFTSRNLSPEVELALAATPSDRLLDLPFLQPGALDSSQAAYGIAKRCNQLRVQAASAAWGGRGARVNSVSPGVIATSMGRQELAGAAEAVMRQLIENSATGRVGTSADIAAAVAFLLSSEASFIAGTDLLVDGGAVAGMSEAMGKPAASG
ncbi:short-chain dehydrogenase [Mycobacterium sp. MS1601]|uniref:SDR family oxidoreductase n=1 Tax=Mycobacterium sp. MS1601 TaxID=1936029 RepID=UPI0009790F2E|nr:SDR family oxidoreductase [Mycobacterium sp. MS1601]AQA04679.1 short-chain dehydrogenase [Mycobacterium sp. MS1601]